MRSSDPIERVSLLARAKAIAGLREVEQKNLAVEIVNALAQAFGG
jgi:hypothetical protein